MQPNESHRVHRHSADAKNSLFILTSRRIRSECSGALSWPVPTQSTAPATLGLKVKIGDLLCQQSGYNEHITRIIINKPRCHFRSFESQQAPPKFERNFDKCPYTKWKQNCYSKHMTMGMFGNKRRSDWDRSRMWNGASDRTSSATGEMFI